MRHQTSTQTPLVFAHAFESLFQHVLGPAISFPGAVNHFAKIGVDTRRPLYPTYDRDVWIRTVISVARMRFPQLDLDDALYETGILFIRGYENTLVGKAVLALIRALGPERTVSRAHTIIRSAGTNGTAQLTPLGPSKWLLRIDYPEELHPFCRGLAYGLMSASRAKNLRVEFGRKTQLGFELLITWD